MEEARIIQKWITAERPPPDLGDSGANCQKASLKIGRSAQKKRMDTGEKTEKDGMKIAYNSEQQGLGTRTAIRAVPEIKRRK